LFWCPFELAKQSYREAVAAFREACRKAGVDCEFPGGRSENASPKVSFIVEKADKGIRVMVKGKPDSEELIPLGRSRELSEDRL